MAKGPSPTARTLDLLRKQGHWAQVVEYTQQSYTSHQIKADAQGVIAAYTDKGGSTESRHGSLRKLRGALEGWRPGKKIDLFGFIDILVMKFDGKGYTGLLGIQATSGDNVGARVAKIKGECDEAAKAWLQCGGEIEVWGWTKYKTKVEGDRRSWRERIVPITRADFYWDDPPF